MKMKKIYYVVLTTFMLLLMQQTKAQIYQQQFGNNIAAAHTASASLVDANYVSTTSPSNSQATYIGNSGNNSGGTVNITGGQMSLSRNGASPHLVRNVNFTGTGTTASAIMFRFDYTCSTSSGTATAANTIFLGSSFANSGAAPTNFHSSVNLAVVATAGTPGPWKINNTGTTYTTSTLKTVLWVVNNSGSTLTYRAPDGSNESVANDTYDVWVGTTKEQNDIAAAGPTIGLTNFSIRGGGSVSTGLWDNILVDSMPGIPTIAAASSVGNAGFTANWSTISGVNGYSIDVSTASDFSSFVSGYNNLYVSGQSTSSLAITGLNPSTQYYYRVRGTSRYTVGDFAGGNSSSQTATTTCSNPSISIQPSTSSQTFCAGASGTNLSITASGATSYQWYSNATASNTGGTSVGSANGGQTNTYTPSNVAGTAYYYCVAINGACSTTSNVSGLITVNSAPVPTFTASASATTPQGSTVTYTTQVSQSSYSWSVPGSAVTDYNIISGGIGSSDNTVTIQWVSLGSKVVTVNYTSGGCPGASAASSTTLVSATTFYNKANSDITNTANWGLSSDGTGTTPTDFTSAGLTFNLYNTGATMSTSWSPNGAGTVVNIGDGSNAVSFNATSAFTPTVVNVANNATLQVSTATIPTLGTLGASSTINYAGTSQAVTATSYGNLTISGSGVTLSGTTNIAGTFTPGSSTASSGTIVLNGTSSSQAIPAFAYQSLTVSGIDGKSTAGSSTVSGVLTMNNSFTLSASQTILLDSLGSMSSTAGKTLTVNGTFDRRFPYNSNTFSAGSGAVQIASGGTFKASGRSAGNNASPNQLTFTNVNFASGTSGGTLHVTAGAAPRIPTAVAGNVIWAINSDTFAIHNIVSSAVPTMNTIGGHLTIANTGAAIASLAGGSSSRALTVSGNLYMTSGRFDVATYSTTAGGATATGANLLTINGDVIVNSSSDTLYTTSSPTASSNDTIFIKGNLIHTAGVIGKAKTNRYVNSSFVATPVVASNGVISFNGSSAQTISTIGMDSSVVLSINNAAGVTMSTNVTIDGSVTMTNGVLRTNGNTLTVAGASATPFIGTSFGSATSSFVAICDVSGTTSSTGGVTVNNIGSGGRTGAILFPIGATPTTYNPFTINNTSAAVAFTAKVSNTAIVGVTDANSVQRTWNIQPATGSPSSVIAMQWSATDEGASFTRTSSSIAHSTGSAIDVQSGGANAAGSNPYTLSSNVTSFTGYGDFGVTNGVVILASEPAVQASNVVITPASTSMNISWTKGSDATYSLVVVKLGSAVNAGPIDATGYTSASAFLSGTQIGIGNYVVYSSTGNSINVTGLTANTIYHVAVYSFNGSGGQENYLTTAPATANTTTNLTTYYYVGGAGGLTSTTAWNTASRWATSLGGTPLTAFAASNTDQYIFDGSNLGTTATPYTGAASIAAVNSANVIGKIVVRNNATVTIASTNSATTITLGNSGFVSNTTVLSVEAGSTLSFNGSTYAGINLQANSSASISGTLNLGNATNVSLVPNATGSTITFNNGAVCESNQSSSATTPFGTAGSGLVIFSDGSTFKHTKGADAFGGATYNVASFASNSLYWFNNTSTSSSFNLDGRTYGNVKISASASPAAGANGFTMYNLELTGATTKLSTAFTGTNNHIKGNITIPAGDTLRFSPGTTNASTLNFSGTSAQTISTNLTSGYWQVISSGLQSFVLSNTAGLSISGNFNMGQAAGTSFTINSGCNLHLASDTLTVGGTSTTGALVVNGTITRGTGVIKTAATSSTAVVSLAGMSSIPAGLFVSNTVRNLTINRSAGISTNGTLTVTSSLTLTDGIVTTGSDTLVVSAGGSLTRSNGWVNGNLRKNIPTGTSVASTFDIGDASNYLPVAMNFASVTNAGDLVLKINSSASSQPNYATATISNSNYINRYWSIGKVGSLAFTTYNVTFNYLAADIMGTATPSTVIAARYLTNWSKTIPTAGTNANTVNSLVSFGDFILADCITYTPTISITSNTTAVCSGSSVTFTASAASTGPTPSYQWKKNGVNIGTNSTSLVLQDVDVVSGDAITCVLTPNNLCQTTNSVTSNSISLTVGTLTPSVSISTTTTTICSGVNTTFTAVATNGGSSPNYQWKKNGVDAGSGSTITFLSNTLSNGDVITCLLTANNPCQTSATATSNAITMTVKQSPSVAQITNGSSTITSATSCTLGNTYKYYDATPYGTWSSSDPTVASVTGGSQAGVVTANTNGTATISYNIAATNGCVSTSSVVLTVAEQTAPTNITARTNSLCVNDTVKLSSTAPIGTTGVWSTPNDRGIISTTLGSSTIYTAKNAGNWGEARYTVTNTTSGCKAFASYAITVNATPVVPTITFAAGTVVDPRAGAPTGGFCVGRKFRVAATPNVPAGVWSATGAASIAGTDTVKINAVGAGSIKYTYTSAAGCVNSRTMNATGYTCAARGTNNSEQLATNNEFTMYPNPSKGLINLQVETLVGAGSIVVTDLYGKSVKTQALSMGANTVNISNLSKGFYLVSVITSEGKTTKKLVVE